MGGNGESRLTRARPDPGQPARPAIASLSLRLIKALAEEWHRLYASVNADCLGRKAERLVVKLTEVEARLDKAWARRRQELARVDARRFRANTEDLHDGGTVFDERSSRGTQRPRGGGDY